MRIPQSIRWILEALHLNCFGVVDLRRLERDSNLRPPGNIAINNEY
jgi:hypothetical protein